MLLILDRLHFEMQTQKIKVFKASRWLSELPLKKDVCSLRCQVPLWMVGDNAGSSACDTDIISMVLMEGVSSWRPSAERKQ